MRPVRIAAMVLAVPVAALVVAFVYYYISFSRLIDARLHGERDTVFPRVYARPLELRRGQSLTPPQLIDRLNDLSYAQRPKAEKPGEFDVTPAAITIAPRGSDFANKTVRVIFQRVPPPNARGAARRPPPTTRTPDRVLGLELAGQASDRVTLDAPVLTALVNGEREKRRPVALAAIPTIVTDA